MLYHYKYVEDAIRDCLAAGFNDQITEAAVVSGFTPFTIDFSDSSDSFVMDHVDPAHIERSALLEFPGLAVYTSKSQDGVPNVIRGVRFSGAVVACVDFYLLARNGREGFRCDAQLSAAEGTILSLFQSYVWPVSQSATVSYSRRVSAEKTRVLPLGDGYAQCLSLQAQFGVVIP